MVRNVSVRDLEFARYRMDHARDSYRPNSIIKKLTSAAIATAFVCGIYVLDRYFFNGDFLNNTELHTTDKFILYTAAVSGLVSGLGLMRRCEETSAKEELLNAEMSLDDMTREYYEQETMKNLEYSARCHRHPR